MQTASSYLVATPLSISARRRNSEFPQLLRVDRVELLRLGLSRPNLVSFTLFRSTNLPQYFLDDLRLVVCPGDHSGESQAIK
jgi:hypothetical protein